MSSRIARTITARQWRAHEGWVQSGKKGAGRLEVRQAELTRTQLGARNLRGALFHDTRLDGVDLGSARLQEAEFTDCEIDSVSLLMATFSDSTWTSCRFTRGRLGLSYADRVTMVDCRLDGAELERCRWLCARLTRVSLIGANMRGVDLTGAVLEDCDLRDVDLTEANLDGAVLRRCNLGSAWNERHDATLEECSLDDPTKPAASSPDAEFTLRIRKSHRVSVLRQLSVILASTLLGVGLAIGVFALTGHLGYGIVALFVLGPGSLVGSGFAARALDRHLDGKAESISVNSEAIHIPWPDSMLIQRAGLFARAGWYSRRFWAKARGQGEDNSRGIFLHLKWADGELLLEATDGIGDAGRLGVKRFRGPPGGLPHCWVWSDELSALVELLGASGSEEA